MNLDKVNREALRELIVQSWTLKAPPKLRAMVKITAGGLDARSDAARRGRPRRSGSDGGPQPKA